MERKLLSTLAPGDRFYFVGDRKKKVYQLDAKPFFYKKQAGYNVHYANCIDTTAAPNTMQVTAFKSYNRYVIFLRNVNYNPI